MLCLQWSRIFSAKTDQTPPPPKKSPAALKGVFQDLTSFCYRSSEPDPEASTKRTSTVSAMPELV